VKTLTILSALLFLSSSYAQLSVEQAFFKARKESTGGGNSGDAIAQEFTGYATETFGIFKIIPSSSLYEAQVQLLEQALRDTKVYSVNFNLCWEENPNCSEKESLVSKNFPADKIILVNRTQFSGLETVRLKMLHSFHEYAGISKIEENNYSFSSKVLDATTSISNGVSKKPQTLICTTTDGKWEALFKADGDNYYGEAWCKVDVSGSCTKSNKKKSHGEISIPNKKFSNLKVIEEETKYLRVFLPKEHNIKEVNLVGKAKRFRSWLTIQTVDYVLGKGTIRLYSGPTFFPVFGRLHDAEFGTSERKEINCIFKDFLEK